MDDTPDQIDNPEAVARAISYEQAGPGDDYTYEGADGNRNPVREDTWDLLRNVVLEQEDRRDAPVTVAEAGTGRGVSAIHFSRDADPATEIHTAEWDEHAARSALQNLHRAGLNHHVVVYAGDANDLVDDFTDLTGRQIDILFLDHVKEFYRRETEAAEPHMIPGSLVLYDNVHDRYDELRDAVQYVRDDPDYRPAFGVADAIAPDHAYDDMIVDTDCGLLLAEYMPEDT